MSTIYETTVQSAGPSTAEFLTGRMIITFGDNAPAALADYVFKVLKTPVRAPLAVGQVLRIGDASWTLSAVGDVAAQNLHALGHVTVFFDGADEPGLPGAIHVAGDGEIEIEPGMIFQITD